MITGQCGHHCGIRSNAEGTTRIEGHCGCDECRCPQAGTVVTASQIGLVQRGVPMCDSWRPQELDP